MTWLLLHNKLISSYIQSNIQSNLTELKMLKPSPFSLHSDIILMDTACIWAWEWWILWGCGLISPCSDGMKSPMPYVHTHTQSHKHRCTRVCHSPQHALTHWLADFVMGLSLTHWLCYVTTTEAALPSPLPSVSLSLGPPLYPCSF